MDGVVVDVIVSPGEHVHEQAIVMTIAEIDPLNVEVFVPVTRYGSISTRMPAEVRPEAPVGGTCRAKVAVVDRVLDTRQPYLWCTARAPQLGLCVAGWTAVHGTIPSIHRGAG